MTRANSAGSFIITIKDRKSVVKEKIVDRGARCFVLADLATIAGAGHLPAGAMASLAARHFRTCSPCGRSAHGNIAGQQGRYQQDRSEHAAVAHHSRILNPHSRGVNLIAGCAE